MSIPRRARTIAASAVTALAAVATLGGCVPSTPAQPEMSAESALVLKYLTAISEGDATTARALDGDVEDKAPELFESEALRTDAVLQGAAERIADIEVNPTSSTFGAEQRVTFDYSLGGERLGDSLAVVEDGGQWRLDQSFTGTLTVEARVSRVVSEPVPFLLDGMSVTPPADPAAAPNHLLYVARYEITGDFDTSVLEDRAALTTHVTISPNRDGFVSWKVSALPAATPTP